MAVVEHNLEEKSLYWRLRTTIESFFAGERITAVKEQVWGVNRNNPDKPGFMVTGTRVRLLPTEPTDM